MFQEIGNVVEKICIMPGIYQLTVGALKISQNARPGQFVMVRCQNGLTFLRRPLSIASVNPPEMKINLLFKVVGPGTKWLSELSIGNKIDIFGPLGHGYDLTEVKDKKILSVAGGVGVASLVSVAEELVINKKNASEIYVAYGDQTLNSIYAENIMALFPAALQNNHQFTFTTEDGSVGRQGLVTDILANVIKEKGIKQIFACGPKGMLKKVAEISQELNVACQVSLEERMACGVGACLSCACRVREKNLRVCADGPVFKAEEVNWE